MKGRREQARASARGHYASGAKQQSERGGLRHLIGLVWVMHLPRAACYAVAVGVFSAIAAGARRHTLDEWALARLLLGVVCVQIAIAGVQDYSNRYMDAAEYRDSPLVRGLIEPWEALAVPVGVTLVMLALVGSLGMVPLLLACGLLALSVLCVLHFNGSPVSAVLYAVSILLVPLLAWSVFGRWQPFLLWVVPLGAVAGVGLHVAGALPDLEREAAMELRSLPHRLGVRRCELIVCGTLPLLAASVWALRLTGIVPADGAALAIVTGIALLAAVVTAALYVSGGTSPRLSRAGFFAQAFGVVCLAAGWLAAAAV